MSTVLMVEDSETQAQVIARMLARAGFDVLSAGDGVEALAELEQCQPDLVLTDMQMPRMNGLELVEAIRERYPLIPSVLMTAQGSEDIAFQALQRGAASYVPKQNLDQLVATLAQVLAMANAGRTHQRLAECIEHCDLTMSLDNDCTLIPALAEYLRRIIAESLTLDESEGVRLGIALEEALLDALYSGNLEIPPDMSVQNPEGYQRLVQERLEKQPYRERRTRITARVTPAEATVSICHSGPGMDHAAIDISQLDDLACRSSLLMRTFMDEVSYNATGNEVTLVKRRNK